MEEQKAKLRNSLLIGFLVGIFSFLFILYFYPMKTALAYGVLLGFLVGIVIYIFLRSKLIQHQMEIEESGQNSVLYSGGANHFLNREGVGGMLYLLPGSLIFKSHRLNLQVHQIKIPLDSIGGVDFFNVAGFVPNGLFVQLKDGTKENFVVNNRKIWKQEILKAVYPAVSIG